MIDDQDSNGSGHSTVSWNFSTAANSKKSVRTFRVAVMGTVYWLEVMAELLSRAGVTCEVVDIHSKEAAVSWMLRCKWRHFDAIHHIYGPNWWWGTSMAILRKPIIWHWIGTDVLDFHRKRDTHRDWQSALTRRAAYQWACAHLADSPDLAEELQKLGIQARVVRLLPKLIEADIEPLPQKFSVLSYWGPNRKDFYRGQIVLQLAEEFPDIEFKIINATGEGEPAPPNVRFLKFQKDVRSIYNQSSVLIRLPLHDSLSAMVLEMLARGRYVIYSKRLPGVHFATSLAEARKALYEIRQKAEPNRCGSQMVRERFSLNKEAQKLSEIYGNLFGCC